MLVRLEIRVFNLGNVLFLFYIVFDKEFFFMMLLRLCIVLCIVVILVLRLYYRIFY